MKKILLIAIAAVLAISMAAVGCGNGNGEEGEAIDLDFATFWPSTDFQAGIGHVNWANAVKDRVNTETDNTMTIGFTYSVRPDILWTGVNDGTYDVITTGPGYTGGIMPLWAGPEYASDNVTRKNALTMSMALQATYDEFTPLQSEMAQNNIEVMHFWSTGPGYFLMNPGDNVTVLEDFEDLENSIRSANPASDELITALGGDPYNVSMAGALEAFQTGLLDGILCPTDTNKGFGLLAYLENATFAPFSYQFVFMKVMNKDTWEELPDEVQTIIEEVNDAWPEYYGELRTWGEAEGLEYALATDPNFRLYDLPSENATEYQRWIDATDHLIGDWIGTNTTRQALWDLFVEKDEYYTTTEPWASFSAYDGEGDLIGTPSPPL